MKAFEHIIEPNSNSNEIHFNHTELESIDFNEIIKICQPHCSYFTLTEQTTFKYDGVQYKAFIQKLSPYLIDSFLTTEWFCYFTSSENKLKISVYYLNNQTKQILSDTFPDIFMDNNLSNLNIWFPEDICFFRKDKSLFFGSVSHEYIARFYLTEKELKICQIPKTFKEIPNKSITIYNGDVIHLWSNYKITFPENITKKIN